ncbi:unnamed protein product [Fusarium graminearum]|nr:unnamed protein product [Fusarium graminearum]CAG1992509.1 unnamed protein product [Fusarium graminearum]VTO85225.1 unnamed protein product [Fusarium graminearum]
MTPEEITNGLRKPLVILNSWGDDQTLKEGTETALRWGAILFVDERNVSTDHRSSRGKSIPISMFSTSVTNLF